MSGQAPVSMLSIVVCIIIFRFTDRSKFGNRIVRALAKARPDITVYPVNPKETVIEGIPTCANLSQVFAKHAASDVGVSIITPPAVSLRVVTEALDAGVKDIWLQPGADSSDIAQLVEAR